MNVKNKPHYAQKHIVLCNIRVGKSHQKTEK